MPELENVDRFKLKQKSKPVGLVPWCYKQSGDSSIVSHGKELFKKTKRNCFLSSKFVPSLFPFRCSSFRVQSLAVTGAWRGSNRQRFMKNCVRKMCTAGARGFRATCLLE